MIEKVFCGNCRYRSFNFNEYEAYCEHPDEMTRVDNYYKIGKKQSSSPMNIKNSNNDCQDFKPSFVKKILNLFSKKYKF